jgi:hyperosmotically inducible periplasmic protein
LENDIMRLNTSRLLLPAAFTATAFALLVACNNASETTAAMQSPPVVMANPVGDTVITANVKSALLAVPAINSADVQVETRKGMVELSGTVDTQAQADQAAQIASTVSGAHGVKNELKVKP